MDLECRPGGRKERIWGGGRLSSLSQAKSPRDKPRCLLERRPRRGCVARFQPLRGHKPATADKPRTKATPPGYGDNSACCKLLSIAFLSLPPTAHPTPRLRAQALSVFPAAAAIASSHHRRAPLSARGSQGSAGHSASPPTEEEEEERNNEGPGLAT